MKKLSLCQGCQRPLKRVKHETADYCERCRDEISEQIAEMRKTPPKHEGWLRSKRRNDQTTIGAGALTRKKKEHPHEGRGSSSYVPEVYRVLTDRRRIG